LTRRCRCVPGEIRAVHGLKARRLWEALEREARIARERRFIAVHVASGGYRAVRERQRGARACGKQ